MSLEEGYKILGISPGASMSEVKQAYRDLVQVWHPDRFAHDVRLQAKAQEKLKQINVVYEMILKGGQGDNPHQWQAEPESKPRTQPETQEKPKAQVIRPSWFKIGLGIERDIYVLERRGKEISEKKQALKKSEAKNNRKFFYKVFDKGKAEEFIAKIEAEHDRIRGNPNIRTTSRKSPFG